MRKNVLITGASSGLGAGMARILAAKGHNLALTARRVDRLEVLKAEIEAAHPDVEVVAHALDVNDHDQVFAVFKQAIRELGGLDRVIVNAGLGKGGRIGTGKFYANKETAETNFVAALAQCEAAMEHFYERKAGHLVVISSVSAMRGLPSAITTYAATKAAVAHLAEGIRCRPRQAQGPRHQGHHPVPRLHRLGDERGREQDPADGRHRDRLQVHGEGDRAGGRRSRPFRRGRGRRSASS